MKQNFKIIFLLFFTWLVTKSNAQIGTFGSGYFQNQYIFNPAMAGLKNGELNLNLAYLGQANSGVDNSAFTTIYGTADYAFNKDIGAGVAVYNDKAGLINSTKIVGTYSFHMDLGDDNQRLHLGVSAIGIQQKLRQDAVTGDPNDPSLINFNNDRKMQFESDFGAAYTDDAWTLQATVPNLVALFKDRARDEVFSQTMFLAAASYKIKLTEEGDDLITLEPKAVYRGLKQTKNVFDGGANLTFLNELLNVYGMYHSTQCITAGIGFKFNLVQASASYNSKPSTLSGDSFGNSFEIGFRFSLSPKKK